MFIPDPDFYSSRIKQQHQKRGKFFCPTIFCSRKYHKIVNNFMFEQVKKKWFLSGLNGIYISMQVTDWPFVEMALLLIGRSQISF
jgi:hypothetical protein